jgi:hypothetical protein
MYSESVYAGADFSYSTNVALSNTMSWTANAFLTTLDLLDVFAGNSEIGLLTANLTPIVNNTPNSVNMTLTLTAPGNTTAQWLANSVNPNERVLYLFTKFTSNGGNISYGNTTILRVNATLSN